MSPFLSASVDASLAFRDVVGDELSLSRMEWKAKSQLLPIREGMYRSPYFSLFGELIGVRFRRVGRGDLLLLLLPPMAPPPLPLTMAPVAALTSVDEDLPEGDGNPAAAAPSMGC